MKDRKIYSFLALSFLFSLLFASSSFATPQEQEQEILIPMKLVVELRQNNKEILNEQKRSIQTLEKLKTLTNEQAQLIEKQDELLTKEKNRSKELVHLLEETNKSFNEYSKKSKQEKIKAERQRNIFALLFVAILFKKA